MVRTNKILITSGALTVILATSLGVVFGMQESKSKGLSIEDLNRQCQSSRDANGFGSATLSSNVIKNQNGSIDVDCVIKIPPGMTIRLQHVNLQTNKLVIESGGSGDIQSHLILDTVDWRSKEGGLQFSLQPNRSTLTINDSSFDYPLSIGATIGTKDTDLQTALDVKNSQFKSLSPNTEGIQLVSMGSAIFTDNQFSLYEADDIAIILGETCTLKNNTHANQRCHGP